MNVATDERRAGAPHQTTLVAFCRAAHPELVAALAYYTGDRDLAEELTQETLVRVCVHWDKVQQADNAMAWATRVAFNLARSRFRRRTARRRALERLRHQRPAGPGAADSADALAVRRAVAALPTREREALVLRYFLDLGVREVAHHMKCPEGTVKTLTRQAIARLRSAGLEVDDA